MLIPTHYEVLGVAHDAPTPVIRSAYRSRARAVHPDLAAHTDPGDEPTAVDRMSADRMSADRMSAVNEAHRVLSDPRLRAMYDRTIGIATSPLAGVDDPTMTRPIMAERVVEHHSPLSPPGPARVPWKLMGVVAAIGSILVLVSSVFDDPPSVETPDGLIRPGSCVVIEPNGDAREVACTAVDDIVVELLIPTDAQCPVQTVGHRDRLGMGIACIRE